MKSIAKADAWLRDLKEKLQFRGFTISESRDSNNWPKLTINTDQASIKIVADDAVSKDVFGNALVAFTPHTLYFASRNDAMSSLIVSKLMAEIAKLGVKIIVQTHATVLATAEAAAGDAVAYDVLNPISGN
jgi:hypothetical protein